MGQGGERAFVVILLAPLLFPLVPPLPSLGPLLLFAAAQPNQYDPDGFGDLLQGIGESPDGFPPMEPLGPTGSRPVASFTVEPPAGDITTIFELDASATYDVESGPWALQVRWDFDGDGGWDYGWTFEKFTRHQYATPGTYTIRLQVRDTDGQIEGVGRQVVVDPDTTPPQILHSPLGEVRAGEEIVLRAEVMDAGGLAEVVLHHRELGETGYRVATMFPLGDNLFGAVLPGKEGLVGYYIAARDLSGNGGRAPEVGEYVTLVTEEVPPASPPGGFSPVLLGLAVSAGATAILVVLLLRGRREPPGSRG